MALRLKSSCGEIEVFFQHKMLTADEVWDVAAVSVVGSRRCSTAIVRVNGVMQKEGTIVCHPRDNFNKALGRQKSLTKALSFFTKAIRKSVWNKYESEIGFA